MDILYVSQYFPPEPGAPAARVYELSRAWVQSGAKVSVLTAFPNHPTGVVPSAYRGKLYQSEVIDGIKVHRTFIYPAANKGFWKRSFNYISFAISALLIGLFKVRPPDIVVATSPQFLVALSGYVLARLLRAPFVFEVRDLWPASIVAVGALDEGSIPVRLLEVLERYLYRHSEHVVVVSEPFKGVIASREIPESRISVINNGVDLNLFQPGNKPPELLRAHNLEGKFVVSYIGTVGMAHGVGMIIGAARQMRELADIHFVIVGEGAERAELSAIATGEGLNNVTFVGAVPRSNVRDWILASDVCAVTLRDKPLFQMVLPSKMFEIMSCARPIILSVTGESARLLERARAGILVRPENIDQFRSAVLRLKDAPLESREMGANGRAFVEAYFDRAVLANSYLELLAQVALKPKRSAGKLERRGASARTQSSGLSHRRRELRGIVKYLTAKAYSLKSYRSEQVIVKHLTDPES